MDEFGREIPAARARRDRSRSPYGSPSRSNNNDVGSSHLYDALPTSRHGGDRNSRKRRHRSESPMGRRKAQPHPSTIYAEEPMLCQYLWKEQNPDKGDDEYTYYQRSYGLNYVRSFFNEHMDDSWFRSMYSPLGRYNVALQERERASREATSFFSDLETSLSNNTEGICFFVLKARLGGGVKQSKSNSVPSTHALSMDSQVLPVQDVPPYVTDGQLKLALMNHCPEGTKPNGLAIYSSSPGSDLNRTAYLYASEAIRKEIIQQLNRIDRGPSAASSNGAHVPRKEDTYLPKLLELHVECSDAYGRLEFDADGKGGAPEENERVQDRKASVWVSTQPLTPNVQVLSAAVSSRERIPGDLESAKNLAEAYDNRHKIAGDLRLSAVLAKVGLENPTEAQDMEDALDVAVAYLRRVHLFSFYNGCTAAPRVADVWNGSHGSATIHLRLANADDILNHAKEQEAAPAASDATPKVDLLVQRLNDKIQKALDECKGWDPVGVVISEHVDFQAKEIQRLESQVENAWIQEHALIDADGRARCSFHFCRKLFKDSSFLKKHLIKKHSEFLRAEMAKCHDAFMMKAWDAQEERPVPPILVDCGRAFSVVPSPVLGAAEPMAADPEPELWQRQQERRKLEQEQAEARRERFQQTGPDMDGPLSQSREKRQQVNYVDVDDMKEEKVDMAFDKVEIPIQPPKKKRKKKKKLL